MKYNFDEFKEYIRGKRAAVVGIGVSNTPLIEMLVKLGAKVTACDKRTDLGETGIELQNMGVKMHLGDNYLEGIKGSDIVFRTPSLRPDNKYLVEAKNEGAYVTSEMEQFLKYCPAKVIGVTGSAGKTTSTSLINAMLKDAGYNVYLGGNIGTPLFNQIEEIKKDDYVVVELSSFQLMDCCYSPDISVVTNISPNHLDMHKDMEEYIDSKKNIFKHQDDNGIVILNRDNEVTYDMKDEIKNSIRMFSINEKNVFSYLNGDTLTVNGKAICRLDEIILQGMHNVENILTAATAVYDYVPVENIRNVATTFEPVEHRAKFVREVDGVKYYNDSIASSPDRTVAGLKAYKQKVILIAGGYDKKIPFDELASEGIDKIKVLVLMGLTKDKIKEAFEKEMAKNNTSIPIIDAQDLEDAVLKAKKAAQKGDIITLSPACASFDMFKNFEERGEKFKEIVNGL